MWPDCPLWLTNLCLGPQKLSGVTECGENGGGEGCRVGECESISSSQRESHMGDTIGNVDIYQREEKSLRDSGGDPSSGDELREAIEGQIRAQTKNENSFIDSADIHRLSTVPGPMLSSGGSADSAIGPDLGGGRQACGDNKKPYGGC